MAIRRKTWRIDLVHHRVRATRSTSRRLAVGNVRGWAKLNAGGAHRAVRGSRSIFSTGGWVTPVGRVHQRRRGGDLRGGERRLGRFARAAGLELDLVFGGEESFAL